MNIELYIKNRLCDIDSPESLGIRLKRQFINPAELSIKDAQMSYEISLPATANNNEIFSHVNVEETKGKFRIYEDARLYVDGILILDGKFRLSEITQDSYKGNLGVPAPLTVKDIFGETMMNQAGKWEIEFEGAKTITEFNTDTYDKEKYGEIVPCIFPFALYGLMQKDEGSPTKQNKDVFDEYVRFRFQDIPPSVNCLKMLQHIFKSAAYNLSGSAFDDERLKQLYISYKNPNDYELEWGEGKTTIEGEWRMLRDGKIGRYPTILETGKQRHIARILSSDNNQIFSEKNDNIIEDGNIIYYKAPLSGLYKLKFTVNFSMPNERYDQEVFMYDVTSSNLNEKHTEIQIIKNINNDYKSINFDNTFYKNNQKYDYGDNDAVFPKAGEVNFIDPLQNKNFVSGFAFGKYDDKNYINPRNENHCNPMAIKGGFSWNTENFSDKIFSATQSTGYVYRDINRPEPEPSEYRVELNRTSSTIRKDDKNASGEIHQVVWLEKGDTLDIIGVSFCIGNGGPSTPYTFYNYAINYTLELEPFQHYIDWMTIDDTGGSTKPMNWDDNPTFKTGKIDLVEFLSSNVKINDWIDNFCKAFNLSMIHKGDSDFELNVKNKELVNDLSYLIDIDNRTDVTMRRNESLKLPYVYELGFTIDTAEQGYYESMAENDRGEKIVNSGNDGGGKFYTNSYEATKLTHSSDFSYNWQKTINYKDIKELEIPVISDHEIWEGKPDYNEMKEKKFFDKPQRFWYRSGTLDTLMSNDKNVTLALVDNEYKSNKAKIILNYKDKPDTITKNYFLLLADNDNNYTQVDCFLSAEEYYNLHKALVRLNGDLYHIASVDGYDPLGKNKCTLKLIRKII